MIFGSFQVFVLARDIYLFENQSCGYSNFIYSDFCSQCVQFSFPKSADLFPIKAASLDRVLSAESCNGSVFYSTRSHRILTSYTSKFLRPSHKAACRNSRYSLILPLTASLLDVC